MTTSKPRYNRNIILNIGNFRHTYINQTNKLKPPSVTDINSVLNISQVTSPKIYLGQFFIYLDLIFKYLLSSQFKIPLPVNFYIKTEPEISVFFGFFSLEFKRLFPYHCPHPSFFFPDGLGTRERNTNCFHGSIVEGLTVF